MAAEDIAETIALLATSPHEPGLKACFDLMHPEPTTLRQLIELFRRWLGATTAKRWPLPRPLLELGVWAGDLASRLGWMPPIRSTALTELRRGIAGDPDGWIAATGIVPRTVGALLAERPATVQELWFARLYLLKPLVIVALAAFWCLSGLIALTVAYEAAVDTLTSRGFASTLAQAITWSSSLMDIAVGAAIAVRRTCRVGLLAGIAVSLLYMAGAAVLTPDLWFEPLGALVKTGPAIVLMAVALAILDKR